MNQDHQPNPPNPHPPRLYTERQLLDMACQSYEVATQNFLNAITEVLVADSPLDDWITYLANAAEHLAQQHRYPGPFLVILGQRISNAGVALIV